jgi:hypothetical protein
MNGTACALPLDGAEANTAEARFGFKHFCFALALVVVVAFWDVLCGTQTFFFRDYGIFGYPLAQFHKECFWRGEMPLWNPLNNCGIPFVAQWNTLTLYPGSLIYLLLPLPWSLSLFCLLHLVLGGAGMYRLAFAWTGRPLAAAVAGVAFAFNGLTLNALMWPNNIAALGWMPWVVYAVERGWTTGSRSLLLGILVATLQMLSGAPEIILFTWVVLFALWAAQMFKEPGLRKRIVGRAALTVLLVGGLAAVQLLPFLDLLTHSQRGENFSDVHWALPGSGWLNFFLPLFGFYRSPSGVCFQPDQEWTSSYYPGVGVVVLAIVALSAVGQRRVLILWIIAALGAVLALGERGWLQPALAKIFPPVQMMRFPVKFMVLAIFAFPLLAAYGVKDEKPRWWIAGSAVFAIVIISAGLTYAWFKPPSRLAWSALLENGAGRVACVVIVAGAVLISSRTQRTRLVAGAVLVASLGLDGLTHAPWQNPTVPPSAYEPGMLQAQIGPLPAHGTDRALMTRRTHDTVYGSMLPNSFNDYCGRRLSLFGNCNLLDGVPTPDGFYSLYLPEQRQIWSDLFFAQSDAFPNPLADFLGISRAVTNLFEWEQRPSAMPLATSGQSPRFADPATIRGGLKAADFDPRRVVFLPEELEGKVAAKNPVIARVVEARWQNARATMEVETGASTILVVAQSFHHNWRAYVDGKETPIHRANYAFQAIEVPAGRSQVDVVYDDRAFKAGSAISLLSLLGWGVLSRRWRK